MSLSNRWKKFLFIAFVFLFPLEVWCGVPTKEVEIHLADSLEVNGKNIVLGDIATIYSKNIHIFKALSDLTVSTFANGETEKTVPSAYLESRIREILPKGTDFVLRAPQKISFRKESMGITQEQFAQEILNRALDEGKIPSWVEAKIEMSSSMDSLKLTKLNEVKIEPAAEMPRWRGEMNFRVSKLNSSELIWVKAKIRWFGNVWVAKKQISPWSTIKSSDFEQRKIEITSYRDDLISDQSEFEKLTSRAKTKRLIAEGSPLGASSLERIPDVKVGQPVRVVFVSESGIRVSAEGATLNPLSVGEEGRAKLRSSKKVVTGTLVSDGVLEVSL